MDPVLLHPPKWWHKWSKGQSKWLFGGALTTKGSSSCQRRISWQNFVSCFNIWDHDWANINGCIDISLPGLLLFSLRLLSLVLWISTYNILAITSWTQFTLFQLVNGRWEIYRHSSTPSKLDSICYTTYCLAFFLSTVMFYRWHSGHRPSSTLQHSFVLLVVIFVFFWNIKRLHINNHNLIISIAYLWLHTSVCASYFWSNFL